jgi:hypothetical protein
LDGDPRRDERVRPLNDFSNMILPAALDGLLPSAPQRRSTVKTFQEAPDSSIEAIKLIGIGLTCLALGIALLSSSRRPPPPP